MSALVKPVTSLVRPVGSLVRSVRRAGWHPGPDPRSLEAFLDDLGYLAGPGSGSARISDALRRFQAAAGLEVDGQPTGATVHALAQARHALLDARSFAA
jgi:hypothetical protein